MAKERVRAAHRIMTPLLVTLLVLVTLGLGLRIYMGREAEDRLAPSDEIHIAELRSPLPKPSYLACPPDYCSVPEAMVSPIFDLPWERLYDYWTEVISGEKRIVTIATKADARQFAYVQHSPVFRFPDIITVEFVPLGPERSSIAIFSRSRYGKLDFQQNRKRVERWLFLLEKVTRPTAPPSRKVTLNPKGYAAV
jgi:Protein of unknown function (DUF1499)